MRTTSGGDIGFEFTFYPVTMPFAPEIWDGLAPGLIGVDQHNRLIPDAVREGCAVPIVAGTPDGPSRPVTISIRKGGGACADPPEAGYGQILWEKTVTTTSSASTETETVSVSLQASPGRLAPPPPGYVANQVVYGTDNKVFGPSCPVPGYRSLDAGAITVQGPGLASTKTSAVPLGEGQVSGLTRYQAILPVGTIRSGSFTMSAAGGADAGSFQSSVEIGPDIVITSPLAGKSFSGKNPLTVNWTGGDASEWVTLKLVGHWGQSDAADTVSVPAPTGTATIPFAACCGFAGPGGAPSLEIIVQVTPRCFGHSRVFRFGHIARWPAFVAIHPTDLKESP